MKRILVVLLLLFAAACGDDLQKETPVDFDFGDGNSGNSDAGPVDLGGMDAGSLDMGPAESCDDGILNQDESDIDCGGSCEGCENGEICVEDEDCLTDFCGDANVCEDAPLATGSECTTGDECASGRCEDIGGTFYCTESCDSTCPGQGLACFRQQCVPDTYCEDPDGDGFGFGPGCNGQPCDRCADDATCAEQGDGSFLCMCNDGFTGDGETCADVDECLGGNPCDPNATCTNTPGSFECDCNSGFGGDGMVCADVDECATGTDNCDVNASCTNLAGSFMCACDAGFTGDGVTCTDVDECAAGTDTCDVNASCSNIPGAFTCACRAGFSGNGFTCSDIDECAMGTDNCAPAAICANLAGTFSCACPGGYTGDGLTCTDINECAAGTDNCSTNATCSNTSGGFDCTCNSGYVGDGVTCAESNPCLDGTATCGSNTQCVNLGGGNFTCLCDSGYTGDPMAGCTDVDECAMGTDACSANADCFNTPGNYVCSCQPGYTGNGFTCADINECATGADNCSPNATCSNSVGSFSCACDAGYIGDGVTCVAQGDTCGTATPIGALPFTVSGDTSDPTLTDNYAYGDNACPGDDTGNGQGNADQVYSFVPPTTGSYVLNTTSASLFSERIYVVTDCAAIDSTCQAATFVPPMQVTLTAGVTYFIIIDGGFAGDEGAFTLDVYEDVCTNNNPCDPLATCTSTTSGAQCACPAGTTGDGFTCTPSMTTPDVGEVVISEIMQNPDAQTDADGEWFELYNASGRTISLDGCRVVSSSSTGADEFTITGLTSVAAGDYVVFARSLNFGGSYDFMYSAGINLNNTTDDIELRCITPSAGIEERIDFVAWDDGVTFPDPIGASMNLSSTALNAVSNDSGTNWCLATSSYFSTDLGTPGSANRSCP